MRPTITQFETRVRNNELEGFSYYGKYNGRFSHEGIAIRTECLGDAGEFVKEMKDDGITLGKWDHQDSLGRAYIVSWSVNRFKKEEE